MGAVRRLSELRVYLGAREARRKVFRVSESFPSNERYGLVSQIRDSSRSVGANIAEAWRRRRYPAAFVAKLSDAAAEAEETRAHLDTAVDCGYMTADEARPLHRSYHRLLAQLTRMQQAPERWTPRRAKRAKRRTAPRKWTPSRQKQTQLQEPEPNDRNGSGSRSGRERQKEETAPSGARDEGSRRVSEPGIRDKAPPGARDEASRSIREGGVSESAPTSPSDEGSRRVREQRTRDEHPSSPEGS